MTPDERQALRDKHHLDLGKYCDWCDSGPFGKKVLWPCDVIKVLDATEAAPCFQNCGHLVSDGPCSKCGWQKTPDISILIQHLIDEADPS